MNFTKTIVNAIKYWTTEKIKDAKSDWNQEDENAMNFIKNKPVEATDDDIISVLHEMSAMPTLCDADGSIITEADGSIVLI